MIYWYNTPCLLQTFQGEVSGQLAGSMNYETTVDASSRGHLAEATRWRKSSTRNAADGASLIIAIAVVVLAAIVIGVIVMRGGGGSDDEQKASQAPAVTVVAPGRTTIAGTIQATGTLAARREIPVGVVGEGAAWSGFWPRPASGSARARCWW